MFLKVGSINLEHAVFIPAARSICRAGRGRNNGEFGKVEKLDRGERAPLGVVVESFTAFAAKPAGVDVFL